MTMTMREELEAVKQQLHARERAKCSSMTQRQYARYVGGLSQEQRATHERMMTSNPAPRMDSERARWCSEMDERMGLRESSPCVTRTRIQLTASVFGAPRTAAAARPPTLPKKPAAAQQRPTARASKRSEHDRELDRRMGLG